VEERDATNDRLIVPEGAIPVKFVKVVEDEVDVIQGGRPLGMANHLHPLPRGDRCVDLLAEFLRFSLERLNLFSKVDPLVVGKAPQFLYPLLQLDEGDLPFKNAVYQGASPR